MPQQFNASANSDAKVIRTTLIRGKHVIIPNPVLIGLAMLTGAGILYLLLLSDIIPVQAVDGHVVTLALAAVGIACALFGWVRILIGVR